MRIVIIGKFQELFDRVRILTFKKNKQKISAFLLKAKIPKKSDQTKHALQPVIPLIADLKSEEKNDKSKFIMVELKARAGAPADSAKYKKTFVPLKKVHHKIGLILSWM